MEYFHLPFLYWHFLLKIIQLKARTQIYPRKILQFVHILIPSSLLELFIYFIDIVNISLIDSFTSNGKDNINHRLLFLYDTHIPNLGFSVILAYSLAERTYLSKSIFSIKLPINNSKSRLCSL